MRCTDCRYFNPETQICDPNNLDPNSPKGIQNPDADIDCSVFESKFKLYAFDLIRHVEVCATSLEDAKRIIERNWVTSDDDEYVNLRELS